MAKKSLLGLKYRKGESVTQANENEDSKIKVVVIDDSEFSRKVVSQILSEEGYQVVGEASNAAEALEVLALSTPDIAIIDMVMPDTTGIELITYATEKLDQEVAIIMMSSLGHEHLILDSISNGALDYLQKPFEKQQLLDSVNKVASVIRRD